MHASSFCTSRQVARCALAAGVLLLAGPAVARAATGNLQVQLHGVPCPSTARIASDLQRALGPAVAASHTARLVVTLQSPSALRVSLDAVDSHYERSIPFERRMCPELASTLALVSRAWLTERWRDLTDNVARPVPLQAAPAARPEPAPAPPPTVVTAPPPPALPPKWHLAALAGVSGQPAAAQPILCASLLADYDLSPHAGLALQAAYDGSSVLRLDPGEVSVASGRLGALARATARLARASRLDLMVGPSLSLLGASGRGFGIDESASALDLALTGIVRWRQGLGERWWFVAAVDASLRAHEEAFRVANLAGAQVVPRGRMALLVGLSWTVD